MENFKIKNKVEIEKEELKDYKYIYKDEDICQLEEGDYIKYYNKYGILKKGGILVKNEFPEKLIIKYPTKDIFWAISLEQYNCIYMKKNSEETDELFEYKKAMNIYRKIKNKELILVKNKD